MDNRHPADELAEIRNKIRELKEQEGDLRTELLELPQAERTGRVFTAYVQQSRQRRIDIEKLEDELGDISKFYKEIEITMIQTRKNK